MCSASARDGLVRLNKKQSVLWHDLMEKLDPLFATNTRLWDNSVL